MNYSFEYIDIILLAMIAGFIFLRLRGILGKKTGHEEDMASAFTHDFDLKKTVKIVKIFFMNYIFFCRVCSYGIPS